MNQRKKIIKSESEIELQNLDVGLSFDYTQNDYQMISTFEKDNETFYKLVDLKNPYKYKLRLKSFVTAQARNDIANFSMLHGLKNVLRVQTDSVSFSKDINNYDENYSLDLCDVFPPTTYRWLSGLPLPFSPLDEDVDEILRC